MTRAVPPTAGARLLADLAALGPYFAVDVHRPGSPVRPPWQPLGELTGSPDALAGRIGEVRERLAAAAGCPAAAVEFRVAASIAQLGLCARLLSPALGAAAAGRALPVDVAQARWIPALGGPFRLSLAEAAVAAEPGTAATAALLAGPVTQIVRAVEAMAVSPRVLWGNVASAVNGAATMIAAARPDLAGPAAEAAAALLGHPALAGTYQGRPLQGFRRRNCCLIYRLSPERPAYCGDCVLGQVRPERSGRVREYVEDRLAVLVQLGVADAVDLPQLVQRRRRRGRDQPQGRVVEDHVRRHAQFLGDRRPPRAQPLEHRLCLGRQFRGARRPPRRAPAPAPAAAARLLRGGAGTFGGSRRNMTGRSPRITSPLRSVSASVP